LMLAMTNKPNESLRYFQQAQRLDPNWPMPFVWTARVLATYPDPNVHEPNSALKYAQHAAELTKYQDATVLETLSVAYAATGNLEKAVEISEAALTLASASQDKELVEQIRERLKSYKEAKH
jgi:tetratricopeptide (TPR) repeat protein